MTAPNRRHVVTHEQDGSLSVKSLTAEPEGPATIVEMDTVAPHALSVDSVEAANADASTILGMRDTVALEPVKPEKAATRALPTVSIANQNQEKSTRQLMIKGKAVRNYLNVYGLGVKFYYKRKGETGAEDETLELLRGRLIGHRNDHVVVLFFSDEESFVAGYELSQLIEWNRQYKEGNDRDLLTEVIRFGKVMKGREDVESTLDAT